MPQYSNSKLEKFENCPRQYKFHYIDRISPPDAPEGIEAFVGLRIHEALEHLYKDQKQAKLLTLDELLALFKKSWDKNWSENVRIVKPNYTPEHYFTSGIKQLTDYYERYKPFDQTYTIGTELRISFDFDEYKITGFVDRLSHDGKGRYEIHDYKTGQYSMTQKQADESRQLALYQIYVEENYKDAKEIDLIWHFTMDNREVVSKREPEQINELKREILKLIKMIEGEKEFKPIESRLCDWCVFTEICPAKKHGVILEKKDKNEYLKDLGLVLVEKYAKQYEEIKEAEAKIELMNEELDKMKAGLIALAKEEDLSVVHGKDYKIKVKIEDKPHFPNKSEKGRKELEKIIYEAGKWDDVSDLSTATLLKTYSNWDKDLVENIRKYMTMQHKESVSKPYILEEE